MLKDTICNYKLSKTSKTSEKNCSYSGILWLIGSCALTDNKELSNKNRIYSALDNYPTIVSAIGGNIEGDKLGLGVNLFSNEKTLLERYGTVKADIELKKKSNFYNMKILKEGN